MCLQLCLATRDHYKATGDVAGANRFEQLAVQTKRDYTMVKACRLRGETLPRFRYENRAFQILQCNTDLGENDLELVIVQGISYTVPNPKEIDTYVKFEFPYPPVRFITTQLSCVLDYFVFVRRRHRRKIRLL